MSLGLGAAVRLIATSLVLALPLGACVTNGSTSSVVKQPALPASARVVRTADLTFPPIAMPSSKRPNAGQRSVAFLDGSTGFVARGGQPFGSNSGGIYLPEPGGIERTTDGGKTWTTAWALPGAFVSWVGFQSHPVGFAAGRQFDTSSTTTSTGQPLWLRTTDAGATWSAITPRVPASIASSWGSLQFVFATATIGIGVPDPDAQSAGAPAVMIRTTDGGQSWSQVALQNWIPTGGLTFPSSTHAFATGFSSAPVGQSSGGQLWTSTDAGQSWIAVAGSQVPFFLYAVDFSDRLHGFAAGGHLAKYEERPWRGLLATNDGGHTWSIRYQSPDADRSNPIVRLHFVDATHGWAANGGCSEGQNGPCGGAVMLTGDGGLSWQMTGQAAVQLSPTSPTEAWTIDGQSLTAGILWHSTDGGANWQGMVRPGALAIDSLVGSQEWMVAHTATGAWTSRDGGQTWLPFNPPILGSGPPVSGGPPTILVESPSLVVVVEGTALRVSQSGGRDWAPVTLPTDDPTNTATAVAFSDNRNGVAIVGNQECVKPQPGVPQGSAAVLTTADGGLTWTRQTTLARYTTGISAVKGLAAATGWAGCGPAQQSIAISRDDGRHWATQNLPFACFSVSAAAPATIWLTCQSDQTIYLATQDGGQTWTKYQSPGIDAAFLAIGPSELWAYGPAGALWHTRDAGRHWTSWVPSF
ncbi:MAG: hypothetical protein M3Z28_11495 [Candidatus Dormibacteraeota bacterium]|nr:hypothetical protein [Candidatus Dormibacteraeota bacterium]